MTMDQVPKKSNSFSRRVTMALSFLLTSIVKRKIVDGFTHSYELPIIMDLVLFIVIFIPFYFLFSKFTSWLYAGDG